MSLSIHEIELSFSYHLIVESGTIVVKRAWPRGQRVALASGGSYYHCTLSAASARVTSESQDL